MGNNTVARKVLVVEDNPDNRKILVYRLRRMAAFTTIEEACDGREALECIHSAPPDLIIMDINMPEVDGLEVTRIVRATPGPVSAIPILLLTAQSTDAFAAQGYQAGCTDYLPKPIVDPKVLQTKVYACLGLVLHATDCERAVGNAAP